MKWYNIIVVGFILIGIVLVQRRFFPDKVIVTTTKIEYSKHDSIIYRSKPVPYGVELPPDTVEIPVDSAKLVARYLALHKEYFTIREYRDTIKVDSIGTINYYGKVQQNKLDSFVLGYNLIHPTKITTQNVVNVKNSLYIGGVYNNGITPSITLNNKDKALYSLGYNLNTKSITIGVAININKIKL